MMNLRTYHVSICFVSIIWCSLAVFRHVQIYFGECRCSDSLQFSPLHVPCATVLRGNTVVDRCRPRAWGILSQFVHHAWIYVGLPGYIFCKLYTVALHCIPSLQLEVPSLVASISILFGAPAGRPLGVPLRPNGPSPSRLRSDAKKSWTVLRAIYTRV
jgi:hypothetical protein